MKLATAFVEVRPDTKQFRVDLDREVTSSASDVSKKLAGVLAGGAFLAGAKKATDAASQLQQAVGGTAAVFGQASGEVEAFAKAAAESAGLSERAARELTSSLGGLLKGFGFTATEAGALSVKLAQLGADLAATFGGAPEEAVQALGAALRGETDPLERFGIALNQTLVNQKAVELGLAASTSTVDQNAKAQATLALIYERSADAAGQFGREADSAAGAAAIAAAKTENASADMGEALLPIYTKISEAVGTLASVFGSLPEPVQTAIIALAGIAALSGPTKAAFEAIGALATIARTRLPQALDAAAGGAYNAAGGFDRMKGAAVTAGIELGLLAAAIALTNDQADRANLSELENSLLGLAEGGRISGEAAAVLGDDFGDLADAIELVAAPSVVSQIENFSGALGRALGDTDDDLSNARATVDDLDAALARLASRDPSAAAAALDAILGSLPEGAAARLPRLLDEYNSTLAETDTAQRTASDSTKGLADDLSLPEQAAKDAADSVDEFREAIEKLLEPLDLEAAQDKRTKAFSDLAQDVQDRARAVEDAQSRLAAAREGDDPAAIAQAQRDLAEAIDATSLSLDGETDAALRNRDVVRELIQNGIDVIETARGQGASLEDLELIRINERESLRETLRQLGFNEQAVEDYVAVLDDIPITKETTLTVDTAAAQLRIRELLDSLNALAPDQQFSVDAGIIDRNLQRAQVNAHATGGTVTDGLFTVGENGVELLRKTGASVDVIAGSPTAAGVNAVGEDQLLTQRQMVELLLRIERHLSAGSIDGLRALQLELT